MASWVEMFHMPMKEIEKRFTRSDMTLIAWRSQETSAQMRKRMKDSASKAPPKTITSGREHTYAMIPEGLPENFYNEENEVDLSKVSSEEALTYFKSFGIYIPVIQPGAPHKPPSEVK
jgi:hypothetical protein